MTERVLRVQLRRLGHSDPEQRRAAVLFRQQSRREREMRTVPPGKTFKVFTIELTGYYGVRPLF